MNNIRLFSVLLLCFLLACNSKPTDPNKQVDEGTITNETYTSTALGWTIEIPKGYTVILKDSIEAVQQRGLSALEKATGSQYNADSSIHLINFSKDRFNNFTSSAKPVQAGERQDEMETFRALYYKTLISRGLKVDTVTRAETLGGLKFNTLYATIVDADDQFLLNQIIFVTIRNGYHFTAVISCDNAEHKEILLKAFRNSQFQ